MKFILLSLLIIVSSGCSTLPSSFTTENIMKVHQGMKSDEIISLFGNPKNVSQTICGSNTGSPWTCTTWEYGQFPYSRASFTFSGDTPKSLKINNFNIER